MFKHSCFHVERMTNDKDVTCSFTYILFHLQCYLHTVKSEHLDKKQTQTLTFSVLQKHTPATACQVPQNNHPQFQHKITAEHGITHTALVPYITIH